MLGDDTQEGHCSWSHHSQLCSTSRVELSSRWKLADHRSPFPLKALFKLHSLAAIRFRSHLGPPEPESHNVTAATKRRVPRQKRADFARNLIALFSHHARYKFHLFVALHRQQRIFTESARVWPVWMFESLQKTLNDDNTLSFQLLPCSPLPPTPPK